MRRFGDRRDGKKVRDIHGVQNILIDFKPNRCDSAVYMNSKIDMTNFVKFMKHVYIGNYTQFINKII